MNRLALAQLRLGAADDVLEVGFGGGDLLRRLLRKTSGRVSGVDVSEAMVTRARCRHLGESRTSIQIASAEALPLPDEAVDKAVSVNSLYFWPDPAAALAELARVLRPNGRLALCFEPAEELRKWPGHRHGFRLYEAAEVRGLMEGAGFGAIEGVWGAGRKPDRFCCLSGTRGGANA